MNKLEEMLKDAFKPGTARGKFCFGLVFFLLALMFVVFGFWKTLFIALLTALGVFIGSAETIGKATAKLIDKIYPPRNQKVVYTQEDIEKVKKVAELKKGARAKTEPAAGAQSESGEEKEAKG